MLETKRSACLTMVMMAAAMTTAACGEAFSDATSATGDPTAKAPALPPPVVGTPTAGELTEELGVFVSERGSDAADGSRARPFASIGKGIATARAKGRRVYVCEGTYRESVTVENGIPLVGGLTCDGAAWAVGTSRSRVASPISPALRANGVSTPTRVEGFDLIAADATEPSSTSYGVVAIASPGLVVVGSRIAAGKGAKGADGMDAVQLSRPDHGVGGNGSGQLLCGTAYGTCGAFRLRRTGGKGGSGACAGAAGHDAEDGGDGGSGGLYVITATGLEPYGSSSNGASPGIPRSGAPGLTGADGASAAAGVTFDADGYVPADGAPGTDGEPGKGGGGGDGIAPWGVGTQGLVYFGPDGAGGGAGGCPGLAGAAGRGGGASVAVLLVDSPASIERSELVAGDGGAGGRGNFGSTPTAGGNPGTNYEGGQGKPGGRGGVPGTSGAGAGGASIVIAYHGAKPSLDEVVRTSGRGGDGVAAESKVFTFGYEKIARTIPASASGETREVVAF